MVNKINRWIDIRRLSNYAETNDCQFNRYREYRIMTQNGGWERGGGGGGGGGVILMAPHLV